MLYLCYQIVTSIHTEKNNKKIALLFLKLNSRCIKKYIYYLSMHFVCKKKKKKTLYFLISILFNIYF